MRPARMTARQTLRGRMFRPEGGKLKKERILVLKTGIAGLSFRMEPEEEAAFLDSITPGTVLQLVRDVDNEHDEWAVAVYLNDRHLGYISRFKNETIARMMDAGKAFTAVVEPRPPADDEEYYEPRRRRAPTEDMSLPFSVYLLEEL